MRRTDSLLIVLRALAGIGDLAWEFGYDHLRHWPPTFILAVWLLGGPIEEIVRFVTAGRLQISVRRPPEEDEKDR